MRPHFGSGIEPGKWYAEKAMAEFSSTDSYRRFAQTVKRETRYVYDAEVRDFLLTVIETSRTRKDSIEKATVLWRAQRGYT